MDIQKRPRGRPKSLFKESSAGTLQSLDRALEALSTLARLERSTLSDLSRETGIPTATTHRILTTLAKHSFVRFDEVRQEWMIGIEAYRAGASFLKRNSVIEVSQPIMHRLMNDTGETANLAVSDASDVVFVGQIETKNPIRAFFPPGARSPMYASGIGKAILSAMEPEAVSKVLAASEPEAFTDRTLSDPKALMADLETTRQRGWSYDIEERYVGMSCIGAVIFNEQNSPCAGISVSGPTARFNRDTVENLGRLVAEAARDITLAVGGRPR